MQAIQIFVFFPRSQVEPGNAIYRGLLPRSYTEAESLVSRSQVLPGNERLEKVRENVRSLLESRLHKRSRGSGCYWDWG